MNNAAKVVAKEVLGERINLCNCGYGTIHDAIYKILLKHEALNDPESSEGCGYGDGEQGMFMSFCAHYLNSIGLLEHGSSINGAWPTREGLAMLMFYSEYGTDEHCWPDWARYACDPYYTVEQESVGGSV